MNLIPKNFYLDDFFYDEKDLMKCDIYEKNNTYYIEIDLPGVKKENINISYNKGYLNISISKNEEILEEEITYIKKERRTKTAQRSFYIGEIDESKIKAEQKEGILKITFPKQEEKNIEKRIDID